MDCSFFIFFHYFRRSEFELLLAQFNTYHDSLLLQNATQVSLKCAHFLSAYIITLNAQAENDAGQKVRRDQQHSQFFAVQASLQAAVTVL